MILGGLEKGLECSAMCQYGDDRPECSRLRDKTEVTARSSISINFHTIEPTPNMFPKQRNGPRCRLNEGDDGVISGIESERQGDIQNRKIERLLHTPQHQRRRTRYSGLKRNNIKKNVNLVVQTL